MPDIEVRYESLMLLSNDLRDLAERSDAARRAVIGVSNWDSSEVDDPPLAHAVDWFYRRWVQQIELLRDLLAGQAYDVQTGRHTYEWADTEVRRAAEPQPSGCMRRPA